jgi:OmcA/MtrC family decaheme c-type cytochrome
MSGRSTLRDVVAAVALASLAACQKPPVVGSQVGAVQGPTGPKVEITSLGVNATGQVVIAYTLSKDGSPVSGTAATALDPAFTLAALGTEPVSGLPAWRSLLLTGAEKLKALPVSPPGTPAAKEVILTDSLQPGPDVGGTVEDLGNGQFRYTYSSAVGSFQSAETLRAGVFLRGVNGSVLTTSTCDGVGAPGTTTTCAEVTVPARQLVLDEDCADCHGVLRAHSGSRHGTRICVTCHTYQHADPGTLDPAAILPAGATWTSLTNTTPNPLELGRLVHRIHRGKTLPTLYKANQSSTGLAPVLGPAGTESPPLPFSASRSTQNPAIAGQEFSVIGENARERIFGQVLWRADANHLATDPATAYPLVANGPPLAAKIARGVTFPRDYRDCDACHAGAADAALVHLEISRRSCQGCHPDVWFGAGVPDGDKLAANRTHVAHPGGQQDDDTQCAGCHVATAATPDVLAPIGEAHVALVRSERYDKPTVEIVSVSNFTAGSSPTIVFKVKDRNGYLKSLTAPDPAMDTNPGGGKTSLVPRAFSSISFSYSGSAAPDFLTLGTSTQPIRENLDFVGAPTATPPRPATVLAPADENDQFTFTFTTKLPTSASGTWVLWSEARRTYGSNSSPAKFYDPTVAPNGQFFWPYSGDTSLSELADNTVVWIDADAGATGVGNPKPRRMLMQVDKCNRCHQRLTYHGSRSRPEVCVACHAPDKTDWGNRPKDGTGVFPVVALATTFDNIEERSLHFKVLVHRIHTGGRSGPASLQLTRPYTGGGGYVRASVSATTGVITASNPRFRDMGEFPNDLAKCTLCHDHPCYRVESVPADAPGTLANETPTITHLGTSAHGADEVPVPPVTAACMGCHATAYSALHTAKYITAGKEQCVSCHGAKGSYSVERTHGLPIEN